MGASPKRNRSSDAPAPALAAKGTHEGTTNMSPRPTVQLRSPTLTVPWPSNTCHTDEPTSRLDPITQQEAIQVLLHAAQDTGAALMLVTHDPHLAAAVGTRTLDFAQGDTLACAA